MGKNVDMAPGPGGPENTTSDFRAPGGQKWPNRGGGALLINVFSGGEKTPPPCGFFLQGPRFRADRRTRGGPGVHTLARESRTLGDRGGEISRNFAPGNCVSNFRQNANKTLHL